MNAEQVTELLALVAALYPGCEVYAREVPQSRWVRAYETHQLVVALGGLPGFAPWASLGEYNGAVSARHLTHAADPARCVRKLLDTLRAEARKTLAENATAVLQATTQSAALMDALGITNG